MNTTGNKRKALRMADEVLLKIKKLDDEKMQAARTDFEARRSEFGVITHLKYGSEKYLPEMRVIERKHPQIASYLKFLEKQIEYVSTHINISDVANEIGKKQQVNLSAGGIRFEFDEEIGLKDHLEVSMVLLPDEVRILALAEVVRVESCPKKMVSAKFVQLHKEDKEALIKHIHKRQMDELRKDSEY